MSKKKKLKITREDIYKLRRKVSRELEIEQGNKGPRGGFHITDKDRPRKRVRPEEYE